MAGRASSGSLAGDSTTIRTVVPSVDFSSTCRACTSGTSTAPGALAHSDVSPLVASYRNTDDGVTWSV
jgi:hypothetical protein